MREEIRHLEERIRDCFNKVQFTEKYILEDGIDMSPVIEAHKKAISEMDHFRYTRKFKDDREGNYIFNLIERLDREKRDEFRKKAAYIIAKRNSSKTQKSYEEAKSNYKKKSSFMKAFDLIRNKKNASPELDKGKSYYK